MKIKWKRLQIKGYEKKKNYYKLNHVENEVKTSISADVKEREDGRNIWKNCGNYVYVR